MDIVRYGQGDNVINLNMVRVWSNKRDVAARKHVRMRWGGGHGFPTRNLVDGNSNSLAHTRGGRNTNWIRIDLRREYPIDYVWLLNRKDCCDDRLKGMYIKLLRGRPKPGGRWRANEVMRSARMTDTGSGWKTVMWQPSIGGTLGPMNPPKTYFSQGIGKF